LNPRNAWLVFQKDWSEIRQSKQILVPIIVLPLVIVVVLPTVAVQLPGTLAGSSSITQSALPQQFSSLTAGMGSKESFIYLMGTIVFAPFTLLVPLLVSSIISSDSFAGEKERKTIEGLLATPLSDSELLVGKILAALVPALVATWASAAIYSIVTDVIDYPLFGYAILPNSVWLVILFGLTPAFALASIGLSVIISSRVNGSREAQQLTGLLVIPIVILMIGEISGLLTVGILGLVGLLGAVAFLDYFVLQLGRKVFSRERLLSKI
jgi:ABC-2 type transport system permease protein